MRFSRKNYTFFIIFPRHQIFQKIPPKTLGTSQKLWYTIHCRNCIFDWLDFARQPWNWSVEIVFWRKKKWFVLRSPLTSKFPTVQSLNTTQHNTTQHNTTQHNTTHRRNSFYKNKFIWNKTSKEFFSREISCGLFLFKSFYLGNFSSLGWDQINL